MSIFLSYKGFKNIKRREARRITPINSIKEEDWTRWLQYFLTPPRDLLHLQIANISFWRDAYKLKCMRQSLGHEERISNDCLENTILSFQDCSWSSESREPSEIQTNQEVDRSTTTFNDPGSQNLPGVRGKPGINEKVELIEHLMKNILLQLCVPFESSCHCSSWVNNHNLFIYDNANTEYKLACSSIQRRTSNMSYSEIVQLHKLSPNPTYYSRQNNHYLSVEDSLKYITQLLVHQYGSEYKSFLKRVYDVCERNIPKKNSMFITGKPNSGKTWFMDCLAAFYLNVGNVKNVVRGQNFPFNDCVNRRLLVWNEPSIMPSGYDSVKMLAGGDPCPAGVKYQGDATITRTPLFFTSNKLIFQQTDVWTSRIFFENWKQASFLKNITGYPHPQAFISLFNFN